MRYKTHYQKREIKRDTYVVSSGDEITGVAWRLGNKKGSYGTQWRDYAQRHGIIDPMQAAGVAGEDERFLLGERLRIGQRLR